MMLSSVFDSLKMVVQYLMSVSLTDKRYSKSLSSAK